MARIRTIKPDFFTSEDIVSLSPLARLLYIALWCEADREGRMVWKPVTFKLRYLPADECNIAALCQSLVDQGLVRLYGDGLAYIPAFAAHQHINPRETVSALPEPDASPRVGTRRARVSDAQGGREGKGREGKGEDASRVGACTFTRWVEKLNGDKAIPETDPVFAYAERVGIPSDYLSLAWMWFEQLYGSGTRKAKRYTDWRAVFRNAVEGNWPKAWYFEGDVAKLTTVGIQLQREAKAA